MRSTWILWLTLALALGCVTGVPDQTADDDSAGDDDAGDDDAGDDDAGDDDAGDDDTAGPCSFHDPPSITVEITERYNHQFSPSWGAVVGGQANDGPQPTLHEVWKEAGECRYLRLHYGFCDPPCGYGEVCNALGECEAYPAGASAGTLTLGGLVQAVQIEPEPGVPGLYYGPYGLPADLFADDATITAAFAGDVLPAASLAARGVAPIDPDLAADEFEIVPGQDNVLTWTPGVDPDACAEVRILGINETHGAPLQDIIWCVGPDDGEVVIAQDLVDAFPLDEIPDECIHFDCPQSTLSRYTADTVHVQGRAVRLTVRSSVLFMGSPQLGM